MTWAGPLASPPQSNGVEQEPPDEADLQAQPPEPGLLEKSHGANPVLYLGQPHLNRHGENDGRPKGNEPS